MKHDVLAAVVAGAGVVGGTAELAWGVPLSLTGDPGRVVDVVGDSDVWQGPPGPMWVIDISGTSAVEVARAGLGQAVRVRMVLGQPVTVGMGFQVGMDVDLNPMTGVDDRDDFLGCDFFLDVYRTAAGGEAYLSDYLFGASVPLPAGDFRFYDDGWEAFLPVGGVGGDGALDYRAVTFGDLGEGSSTTILDYGPDDVLSMGRSFVTVAGDLNFDGVVGRDDLALMDRGYAQGRTDREGGDFNGDDVIDGQDYVIIDGAFRDGGASSGAVTAAVPEPGIGAIAAGAIAVMAGRWRCGRRRRWGRG